LSHCWLKFKDFEKCKVSFKLWYKDGKWTAKDNDDEEVSGKGRAYKDRPRCHKASKTDLCRQGSSLALENTLKSVFAKKGRSKCQER
jgi:hypothetical protein